MLHALLDLVVALLALVFWLRLNYWKERCAEETAHADFICARFLKFVESKSR